MSHSVPLDARNRKSNVNPYVVEAPSFQNVNGVFYLKGKGTKNALVKPIVPPAPFEGILRFLLIIDYWVVETFQFLDGDKKPMKISITRAVIKFGSGEQLGRGLTQSDSNAFSPGSVPDESVRFQFDAPARMMRMSELMIVGQDDRYLTLNVSGWPVSDRITIGEWKLPNMEARLYNKQDTDTLSDTLFNLTERGSVTSVFDLDASE
jgi:hypothetical protein